MHRSIVAFLVLFVAVETLAARRRSTASPYATASCCSGISCSDLPIDECIKRGGVPGAKGSRCPRIQQRPTPSFPDNAMFVPKEWQPKTVQWSRDANGNFIDDDLEAMPPFRLVKMFVALNHVTTAADLTHYGEFGDLDYASPYLPVLHFRSILVTRAFMLAADPGVAHVEWDRPLFLDTDRSVAAAKVQTSTNFPLATWDANCPYNGAGVNIAIIDTGVDDGQHAAIPPAVHFYDFTLAPPAEVNPDDQEGHGTHVAGIALGRPTPFQGSVHRGVAPGAGLIDIRVSTPGFMDPGLALYRALDLVQKKRVEWGIDVVNISLGDCKPTDGKDVMSQRVNQTAQLGVTVVTSMANADVDGCKFGAGTVRVQGSCGADRSVCVQNANYQGTIDRTDDAVAAQTHIGPRNDDGDADVIDEQKPDLSAPGQRGSVGIRSAQHNSSAGYVGKLGTSMAAPHVAGLAALLTQADPSLKWNAAKMKTLLRNTAQDRGTPGWSDDSGAGLLDGNAACDAVTKTAAADLQFTANCNSPAPISWTSSNLYAGKHPIVEGSPNTINATVRNAGPGNAGPFQVELGYYDLSVATGPFYPVATVSVPGLASGSTTTVSTPWNPVVGAGPGVEAHACLAARIVYTGDKTPANDCARRNVSIKGTASPAFFDFLLVNPTDEELTIRFEHDLSVCDTAWSVRTPTETIRLRPGDPPRKVTVALDPGTSVQGARAVAIAAIGVRPNGDQISLSGVTLVAQTPNIRDCNRNGVDDAIDIQIGPSRDANNNGIPDECQGCVNNVCF